MKINLEKYFSYTNQCIAVFVVFIIFNLVSYSHVTRLQKQNMDLILDFYLSEVDGFFNQGFNSKNNSFDIIKIKKNLDLILPSFITYELIFDNKYVNTDIVQLECVIKRYRSYLNDTVALKLGVKNTSLLHMKNNADKSLLLFFYSYLLIFCIVLFVKIMVTREINQKFNCISNELSKIKKVNQAYENNKKIQKVLNKFFTKKITEMYIKEEICEQKNITNEINLSTYLFPVCLNDTSSSVVDMKVLTERVKEYFSLYFQRISLVIRSNTELININCAKEVLYQIVFSIVYNLIRFMDEQSEAAKSMLIECNRNGFTIEYEGFRIDEAKMIGISEDIIANDMHDMFILNFSKVFKSMRHHCFNYKIYHLGQNNVFEVTYPSTQKKMNKKIFKNKANIIDFKKYKKDS